MKYVILLALVACCLVSASGQVRFQSAKLIDTRNGLPQGYTPAILQDHRGFIWVATQDGLCRYDGYTFKVYRQLPNDSTSLPFRNVGLVAQDTRHRLWIRSESSQLAIMDYETGRFRPLVIPGLDKRLTASGLVRQLVPDREGGMWLYTYGGKLFRVRADLSRYESCQEWIRSGMKADSVFSLWQDPDRTAWIGTEKGLGRCLPGHRSFQPIPLATLAGEKIYSLSRRPDGRLVLGMRNRVLVLSNQLTVDWDIPLPADPTVHFPEINQLVNDRQGYTYIKDSHRFFRFRSPQQLQKIDWSSPQLMPRGKLHQIAITTLLIDRSEGLWIGTSGYGMVHANLREPAFRSESYRENFHIDVLTHYYGLKAAKIPPLLREISPYNVRYVARPDGSLWFGSRRFLCHFLPKTQTFRFIAQADVSEKFPLAVYGLTTDQTGMIWGLTQNRLFSCDPRTYAYRFYPATPPPTEWLDLVIDDETVWASTSGSGLWAMNRRTGQTRLYQHTSSLHSLPSDRLLDLAQDPQHPDYLWISTFDFGMCRFNKKTGHCQRYSTQNGLPNDVVYSLIPDDKGYLWISTNKGISRFDPRTERVLSFNASDGLPGDEFNRFHAVRMTNGTVFMGGVEGITWFDPQTISPVGNDHPVVVLTNLQLNNRIVEPTDPNPVLDKTIHETDQLTLNHDQNFLTLDFAAVECNNRATTTYRYRLVQYDRDWVTAGTAHSAVYTGLPPGRYVFQVQATNAAGGWSRSVRSLPILIKPPYWATWWAFSLYTLLMAGVLLLYAHFRTMRIRERREMELKRRETEQLRVMDELKTRFFSNITHEFRTPLTLIQAPAEQLLKEIQEPEQVRSLEIIQRNADHLLRLINQLLDLNKLESHAMTVFHSRGNLGDFLIRTVDLFRSKARQKRIEIRLVTELMQADCWFDAEKLEVIVYNLLSNALKFTPETGQIDVRANQSDEQLTLLVQDTGVGIGPDQLAHIFERFYQGDDSATRSYRGTGIGLALVRELVTLLEGTITVESQVGEGTTFRVMLPVRMAESDSPGQTEFLPSLPVGFPAEPETTTQSVVEQADWPLLLLAEDTAELAQFMETLFRQAHYRVRRVDNGQAAFEQAITEIPDLIVSDVMMPGMDGYELCDRLKQDDRTSHIGVILLTARSAPASRLTGLQYGADDYITKPFRADELLLRIRNRLTYQQRLRTHLHQLLTSASAPETVENPFLQKIYSFLERHLDDAAYGVNELATDLSMSRMSLYRKLKAVTDLSPNELIRNYRLQASRKLLQAGRSVSETAYAVGFDSPQYFATCFKERYQHTPSEFVLQQAEASGR